MRAFTLDDFDATPAVRELPDPSPGHGELLVRVHASSVNPVDNAIAAGMLSGMADHEFPVVLGRDYAGVVEAAPEGSSFSPGDEVFSFVPHADPAVHRGSWADLISVAESATAAKPSGVAAADAGATPLAGISALYCVDPLELAQGQTVLVVGATGGVGSFAVQLAAHAGAHVIATALPEDEEYLRGLGSAEVVNRGGDVATAVRAQHPDGVDAIIDLICYTPAAFDAYAAALKPDGRASSPLPSVGEGEGRFAVMAQPDPAALERLGALLEAGALHVPIQRSYELEQAGEALGALATTHTQGKLAIQID